MTRVDDIEDDSQLRRGRPGKGISTLHSVDALTFASVAHKIYGIPQTINTANYVYFLAYEELHALRRAGNFGTSRDVDLDAIVTSMSAICVKERR